METSDIIIITDMVTKFLIIILLLLQVCIMLYLFYINHKRFQEDKKFWKEINKLYPNEPSDLEGVKDEQINNKK